MPREGLRCVCGSSNIVKDDLYAQTHSVCADCGSVLSEGTLAYDRFGGSDVSYSNTTQQSKKPKCRNLIKGLQRIRALCRVLRVNSEIEQSSKMYFDQVYSHESFINTSLTKKEVLAGCCVLICCRLHNWPITMGTIAYLVDVDTSSMGPVYREALKILNVCVPSQSITDVMEAHCHEYKITSEHVTEELAADTKELTKRALALVELAAESWIVTGRRPFPIMMAATYLSWQSLQPSKLRQKMTLDKFCQVAKVEKNLSAKKRVSEIKEMLCKLGNEIPWGVGNLTPYNVVQHVEDIMKYRSALLRNALINYQDSDVKGDLQVFETKDSVKTEPGTLEVKPHASCADDSCDEPNWGKRVPFAPPCVMKAKKRKREPGSQIEVTGDEEISDSEINSYIRTPQEVQAMAQAQKLFL